MIAAAPADHLRHHAQTLLTRARGSTRSGRTGSRIGLVQMALKAHENTAHLLGMAEFSKSV